MSTMVRRQGNEEGFILVVTMMIMVILTVIGIAMTRNTSTELQIAGNDKVHKQTFYEADGGTEFASEIIEQNIACLKFEANGGGSVTQTDSDGNNDLVLDSNIAIESGSFTLWQNGIGKWSSLPDYPSDANRDMWFPPDYNAGEPHTNSAVEALVDITAGSSIISHAGYIGLGKSSAGGGITLVYQIYSQHQGLRNSESLIQVEWGHVVGREDPFCKYD